MEKFVKRKKSPNNKLANNNNDKFYAEKSESYISFRHTDHQIPVIRPELMLIDKKKRTCYTGDFGIPVNHREQSKKKK